MRRLRSLYLVLSIGIFMGCDFEPGDEILTHVDPASLDGITIDLENYPDQHIQLKSKTEFRYSIQTTYKKLSESRVLLDNQIIWISSQAEGTFQLDPEQMETGSYKLKIEYAATTETGSLAEKLGAEFIYVWTERTVIVNHNIPGNPSDPGAIAITAVENIDNSIKVSWTPYTNFNFEKYEVIRQDYDEKGVPKGDRALQAMSSDPAHTYLFDRQYLGGKSEYKIKLYAAGKTYMSPPVVYEHPYKPNVTYEIKTDGQVTITWNNVSALSDNFYSYKLEVIDYVGGYRQTVTFDKFSTLDTAVTFVPENFLFGKSKGLRLTIYPSSDPYYYSKVHELNLTYGDPFPFFNGYSFPLYFNVKTQNFYYRAWWGGSIHRADENGQSLDSLDRYYTFFHMNDNIAIGTANETNYRINLETMEAEGEIPVPNGNVFGLSDDNKVAIFTNDGGKVFTLEGTELLSLGYPSGEGFKGISPNGQYVFAQPKSYRFNGTVFEDWSSWNTFNIRSVSFLPDEPSKMIVGEKTRIWKYNFEAETNEITTTDFTGPCNFDPVTEKLGCLNGNAFVILNSDDFQLYKTLPVQADAGLFYLLNGKVICSSGTQIELSDIP